MLFTLGMILLIIWFLGVMGAYTAGAVMHLLLAAAVVIFILGALAARRTTL